MRARTGRRREIARRTKIICTIGPATWSQAGITRLARAGMDVARLNFSHGTRQEHAQAIANIRAVERKLGKPIGILQDLSGPKLRVGKLPESGIELKVGAEVLLTSAARDPGEAIPIPVPQLLRALRPGHRLLLADGTIELVVLDDGGNGVRCRVRVGGHLRSRHGVHVPDAPLPVRTVTRRDLRDLRFGLARDVDWVAMSFVRDPGDLAPLRRQIRRAGLGVPLMAKIECHEALDSLAEIIEAADGVMVARGDLGIELPLDRVPLLQKTIIARCNASGKPVVTATQMLETMIERPRPTRAEASDVANAVLDGTDAVMLSGETAVGRYPARATQVMARLAARAESAWDFERRLLESTQLPCTTVTDGICQAAVNLAHDLDAAAIITATATGHTALMAAMYRPKPPIVAVTPDVATQRRLTVAWGVHPLIAPRGRNTDDLVVRAIGCAREAGFVRHRDLVVVVAGVPAGVAGHSNLVKVEVVGRPSKS